MSLIKRDKKYSQKNLIFRDEDGIKKYIPNLLMGPREI